MNEMLKHIVEWVELCFLVAVGVLALEWAIVRPASSSALQLSKNSAVVQTKATVGGLPRPEDRGIVLAPGAPAPSPDPPVYQTSAVVTRFPMTKSTVWPPAQQAQTRSAAALPVSEDPKDMEQQGISVY